MKCKGCTGEIFYVPLAEVKEDRAHAGAALRHTPSTPACEWFTVTPASQIIAYIKVAQLRWIMSDNSTIYSTRPYPLDD